MSAPTTETHAIVNGTAATVTSYPAVVAVLVNNGVCSGVVIAPKLVLTAASCLDPGIHGLPDQQAITNNTTVLVGSVDLNAAGGTTIAAAATAVHPSYAFSSTGNPAALHDVGVVTLGSAAPGATPLPIDVSTGSALGLSVIQVGFGATRFNSSGAPDFASVGRESSVSKTVADCQIVIGASANATNLCYDQSDKKGFCSGDSGGPSIAQIQAVNTVVGLHSYGDQNCSQLAVDARVSAELAFIGSRLCVADGYCAVSCGAGSLPIDPDCVVDGGAGAGGHGGGGAGGTAGAAGTGGMTGAAGTTGARGGTTGSAGDGAAGTTGTGGSGGSGGTTGSGGTGGTGGATGRGGTTGTGGGSDGGTPAAGTERGPCYGNATCNAGLTCLSDVCVVAPKSDGGCGCGIATATAGARELTLALIALVLCCRRRRAR